MFTAHLTPTGDGSHQLTVQRDGYQPRHLGRVDGDPNQGDLFDTAGEALTRNGWRPTGGDDQFWWGAPDGNMFDGPWQAQVEQT
jgi:hypothetical protein